MPPDKLVLKHIPVGAVLKRHARAFTRQPQAARRCLKYPNFVLSSGCDIPSKSPWENIDAFLAPRVTFIINELTRGNNESLGKIQICSQRPVDRLPVIRMGAVVKLTVERWLGEGLPKDVAATVGSLQEYFGLDKCLQLSVKNRTKSTPKETSRGAGIMADERDYERILPTLFPDVRTVVPEERIELLHRQHEDGGLHF